MESKQQQATATTYVLGVDEIEKAVEEYVRRETGFPRNTKAVSVLMLTEDATFEDNPGGAEVTFFFTPEQDQEE